MRELNVNEVNNVQFPSYDDYLNSNERKIFTNETELENA